MKTLLVCIHKRILDKVDKDSIITRSALMELLAMIYHIPKEYRHKVVTELKANKIIVGEGLGYYIVSRQLRA